MRFDSAQLEQWAAFSGDRNPIHFDLAAARRLGVSRVVVHGMLPILHAQAQAGGPSGEGWQVWRTRLKHPMLEGREALLESSAGQRFSLSDEASGEKLFHGRLEQVSAGESLAEPESAGAGIILLQDLSFDAATLAARVAELGEGLPAIASPGWVALSAITFSGFLRQGLPLLREAAAGRSGIAGDILAVQTTHAVKFNPALLAAPAGLPACRLVFSPVATWPIDGGISGTAHVRVLRHAQQVLPEDDLLLELSIGLMMRAAGTIKAESI